MSFRQMIIVAKTAILPIENVQLFNPLNTTRYAPLINNLLIFITLAIPTTIQCLSQKQYVFSILFLRFGQ